MRRIYIRLAGIHPQPVGRAPRPCHRSARAISPLPARWGAWSPTSALHLFASPRVRGLGGWGPGRWSAEPKGTRDSQNSWRPAPLLNHVGVVACKKHRIGNMDFFHIFMKFILLGSFGQMSLQSRPSVFIVFFSWAEPPENP